VLHDFETNSSYSVCWFLVDDYRIAIKHEHLDLNIFTLNVGEKSVTTQNLFFNLEVIDHNANQKIHDEQTPRNDKHNEKY
jgi:hypothetical protein